MTSAAIPMEVRAAYNIDEEAFVRPLQGGLVNQTLLVVDRAGETVMQHMAPMFDARAVDDMDAVTRHLTHHGWEAPTIVPTRHDESYAVDNDDTIWRRTNFIRSDGSPPSRMSPALSAGVGALVGSWHASMSDFRRQPAYQIPHFHDAEYHAQKLEAYLPQLPSSNAQHIGEITLGLYRDATTDPPAEPLQFIHGDPKLTNILFRCGDPFTLIDYDTVMLHSPWTDVGDYLRSVGGKTVASGEFTSHVTGFVAAYKQAAARTESLEELRSSAFKATKKISLMLAMRYLCDIVDGSYFTWDQERFASREDNHVDRAETQLSVARYAIAGC